MAPRSPDHVIDRFQTAMRRHPYLVDTALATAAGIVGAFSRPMISFATGPHAAYSAIVFGCCAAIIIRRRSPRLALTIMAVLLTLYAVLVEQLGVFAGAVCLIAVYTAQTQLSPPWRWVLLTLTYLGVPGVILTSADPALSPDWRSRAVFLVGVCAVLTVASLAGTLRRRGRARVEAALERAAVVEAQRDTERRLAAVDERVRIAREMHDILGHSLNAIAVQAEGARYAVHADPDAADHALATIGRVSRAAVDEVRDLIDVLRAEEETATTCPAPSLRDVPELLATFQKAGAVLRFCLDGDPGTVPTHVGRAAYRIVQEGMTNAVKHAGRAPITIRATVTDRRLSLVVANGLPTVTAPSDGTGGGYGLIGMRERVRALGGVLDAGPDRETGGWRVTAELPWSHT